MNLEIYIVYRSAQIPPTVPEHIQPVEPLIGLLV